MKYAVLAALGGMIISGCGSGETTSGSAESVSVGAGDCLSTNLVGMYRLKDGVTAEAFEAWVEKSDHPTMRGITRVESFRTHRVTGLLPGMGEGEPSVDYIETFSISDLNGFAAEDMTDETVQALIGEFMDFIEAPEFVVIEEIDSPDC